MPTHRRLKTASDLRRFLAHIICKTEKGTLDPQLSGRLGSLCSILYRIIEGAETEHRISRIEEKLGK